MTVLSKPVFETTYADASGTFADNGTRQISEGDLRQFADDIADSFNPVITSIGGLNFISVDIGDWDMDTDATKVVAIPGAISDWKNIRNPVTFSVRDDADTTYYPSENAALSIFAIDGSGVQLARTDASIFDGAFFDSTSFNRGWVTICYVD